VLYLSITSAKRGTCSTVFVEWVAGGDIRFLIKLFSEKSFSGFVAEPSKSLILLTVRPQGFPKKTSRFLAMFDWLKPTVRVFDNTLDDLNALGHTLKWF